MRLSPSELKEITNRRTPVAQATWFKRHFGLTLEHDSLGVILTQRAFDALVARKYGIETPNQQTRPKLKLTRHAHT